MKINLVRLAEVKRSAQSQLDHDFGGSAKYLAEAVLALIKYVEELECMCPLHDGRTHPIKNKFEA